MKAGKTLTQLAQELEARKATAKDYMANVASLEAVSVANELHPEKQEVRIALNNGARKLLKPTTWAHSQTAQYTGIPKAYYDKLAGENAPLLASNINHGLAKIASDAKRSGKPESRMVRTLRGDQLIANLSSRFRRLDCVDMAEAILPDILESGFTVESCEITDTRLYIKALSPKIVGEVKVGDPVQFGIMASNSDVGSGQAMIETFSYRLRCKNGMMSTVGHGARHLGRNLATADDVSELLTDKTKEVTDAAFWLQIRDVVRATMKGDKWENELNRLRESAGVPIKNFNLAEVVELAMDRVSVRGDKTKDSILAYLANGADGAGLTKWGLANAFTFAAQQDHVDYDESIALERAGNGIIELAPRDWVKIAEKAAA